MGDVQLNAGSTGRWVTYTVDGAEQRYDLSDVWGEVILGMFENKAGNSMVLVLTKAPEPATTSRTAQH